MILPDRALLRRLDRVEIIGAGLTAHADGASFRTISRTLSVPPTTVRDWIRRYLVRTAAPPDADPESAAAPAASPWQALLAELVTSQPGRGGRAGIAGRAGSPGAPWRRANRETQGRLLL